MRISDWSSDVCSSDLTNDTQITLGAVTIRNIFGYRHHENQNYTNTAGVGELNVPIGPGGAIVPFRLLASSADNEREYLTDEFQIFGKAFDAKLDWIVGAFYRSEEHPSDLQSLMRHFF